MFGIYGTSGQMFWGPFEELRKVAPALRATRAWAIDPDRDRRAPGGYSALHAKTLAHPAPAHELTHTAEQALHAYAVAQHPDTGRQPLSRVDEVMTHEPVLLDESLNIWQAWQQLAQTRLSQAPVVNARKQLVGLLGWGELMHPERLPDPHANPIVWRAWMMQTVAQWMLSPVPSVEPGTDIRRLALALLETGLPGLPVVAAEGLVIGYVSRSDILRAITHDPPLDLWG
jgi:CBS domain-containing protein